MEQKTLTEFLLSSEKNRKLIVILKKAKTDLSKGKVGILGNVENELLSENGTIFLIVQAFLLENNFRKYKYLSKIYEEMKTKFKKDHLNNWYDPLVTIEENERNLMFYLFPQVSLDKDLIKNAMNNAEKVFDKKKLLHCCCPCCPKKKSIDENQMNLVFEMVRKDTLGIPSSKKKIYHIFERAKGESILIPTQTIQQINCKKYKNIKGGMIGKSLKIMKLDMVNLELSANNKFPTWMNYEITLGILRLKGIPTNLDIGLIVIQIIDSNGLIVEEFEVNVVNKNDNGKSKRKLTNMSKGILSLRTWMMEKKETNFDNDPQPGDDVEEKNLEDHFIMPESAMKRTMLMSAHSPLSPSSHIKMNEVEMELFNKKMVSEEEEREVKSKEII